MMMMVKTVSDVIVRNKTLPLAVMANQAQALSCWLNSILVQAHVGHKGLWRGGRGGGSGWVQTCMTSALLLLWLLSMNSPFVCIMQAYHAVPRYTLMSGPSMYLTVPMHMHTASD